MKVKKRILMLNYEFPPLGGGAGNATYYLLKEFSKNKDLNIDLITASTDKFRKENFSNNITIHYLNINKKGNLHYQSNKDLLTYSWRAYNYCKNLMTDIKYDICHAFFGIPCGYIAMKLRIPYIISLRGSDVPFYNKRFYLLDNILFKKMSKKIWNKSKKVIANSKDLKDLALISSPEQKIDVISNGIDIRQFKPVKNKNNKKIILISTGRLIKRKGYEYLIKALKSLDNFELWLIGSGNQEQCLKNLADKLNANVKFLGVQSHKKIPSYLQKADIFILPSLNEGMSNSILEAMACGLPIITTNTGGAKELIKDNGIIINKGEEDSLINALNFYKNNIQLIKKHGLISRKIAERMSWKNVAEKYWGAYEG